MRRMQKFIGVADAKPASASISSPSNVATSGGHADTNRSSGSAGFSSQDSQYAVASNLQVPAAGASGSFQMNNQLTAPYSSLASPSSLRGSNPPSPSAAAAAQSPYGDYFASARAGRATSPVPSAGPMQTPRPITPSQPPSAAVSPGLGPAASTVAAGDVPAIERADLHKTLKAVEGLLVNLDEYRDLAAKMAKVERKLAKSASELAKVKSVQQAPSSTLAVASTMFDALNDVSTKHAKKVQREYEALNESCAKYFKKVAKEERAHEELVDSLDTKIKKANAAHEKNVKKASSSRVLESHDKYIATVQGLTSEISRARADHWRSMAAKSHSASLVVASTFGGLADLDYRRRCETVRRIGPHVGSLNEWLNFTSSEAMPTLQPADLDENEVLHAQFLANAEAQIQAYAAAQAEAQARMQEEVQTAMRAQQLGWRPPSVASQRAEESTPTTMANLPKLDESDRLVDRAPTAAAEPSRVSADRASIRSRAAGDGDTASILSVPGNAPAAAAPPSRTSQTRTAPEREALGEAAELRYSGERRATESRAAASAPQDSLGVPGRGSNDSDVRLDRAPTGSTIKSMAVQPETWEQSSLAADEIEEEEAEEEQEEVRSQHRPEQDDESDPSAHDRKDSSTAEGTVVDRLSAPMDGSEVTLPSFSRSESAKGSEDGGRMPRTPVDGERLGSRNTPSAMTPDRHAEEVRRGGGGGGGEDEGQLRGILENSVGVGAMSPGKARPAERALDRYKDFSPEAEPTPRYPSDLRRVEEPTSFEQNAGLSQDDYSRARKTSLWERERERLRQQARDSELQMRLREEQALRSDWPEPPYGAYASMTSSLFSSRPASSLYSNGNGPDAYGRNTNGAPGASEPYDPDRYAPAVGRSRLSGVSVSRTLSTDTTASERSFVARMKARYQEEKELERSQRELNALEREKAARRVALPPAVEPLAAAAGSRRVSEMASRYIGSDSMGYGDRQQQLPPSASSSRTNDPNMAMRRYHDSLPTSSGVSGPRNLASPPPPLNEFGSYRDPAPRNNRVSMPPQPSPSMDLEPPHSDVCGCQRCSVRHYGSSSASGMSSAAAAAQAKAQAHPQPSSQQRPPPSRSASQDPREMNVRRQSMPVRPQGNLVPPQPQYGNAGMYGRQSYEDLHAGHERKVAFAHSPQTIR